MSSEKHWTYVGDALTFLWEDKRQKMKEMTKKPPHPTGIGINRKNVWKFGTITEISFPIEIEKNYGILENIPLTFLNEEVGYVWE